MTRQNVFDSRREQDPQGLIDDLLAQTTRQAVAIHELTKRVSFLEAALADQVIKEDTDGKDNKKKGRKTKTGSRDALCGS